MDIVDCSKEELLFYCTRVVGFVNVTYYVILIIRNEETRKLFRESDQRFTPLQSETQANQTLP